MLKRRYLALFLLALLLCSKAGFAVDQAVPSDLTARGIAQVQAENYEEALEILKQAKDKYPESALTALYLGRAYKETGSQADALKYFREALSLTPPEKEAYSESHIQCVSATKAEATSSGVL